MVSRARKIIWISFAREARNSIFVYWNARNKSNSYSRKLNILFTETLERVAVSPEIALKTNSINIRTILVRDYYLIFEVTQNEIIVLDIWDTRQNPDNFPIK